MLVALSKSNLVTAIFFGAVAFGIDQLSKYYVTDVLSLSLGESRTMIPGFVTFVLSKNYGINFGLLPGTSAWALIALSLVVSAGLLIWALRRWHDGVFSMGVGLIVGGALANAYDRWALGAVTDFLNVTCCGINNPFAFNVADVAIFGGVAVLLYWTAGDDKRAATD